MLISSEGFGNWEYGGGDWSDEDMKRMILRMEVVVGVMKVGLWREEEREKGFYGEEGGGEGDFCIHALFYF